ncbi:MAG: type III-B CRISPR-associated protein Cas10/Cmr2 [Saprospiraceae bacterium]|nr:type III-B CRISPR-associated protein Cas10/Cmr2 [Candidatus Vicinibacter affinis]
MYIAITIGPIVDTLSNTRATRELWAASYTFSYLMKEIIRELKKDNTREFIIPFVDEELFKPIKDRVDEKYKLGAGVFPDRIIFKSGEEDTKDIIKTIASDVIRQFGTDIAWYLYPKTENKHKALIAFVEQYFQIDVIQMDLGESPKPILELSEFLNTLELRRCFPVLKTHFLQTFFSWVNNSFLARDAFKEEKHGFDTLLHIATREFKDTPQYKSSLKYCSEHQDDFVKSTENEGADDGSESPPNTQTTLETQSDSTLIQSLAKEFKTKTAGLQFKAIHKYIAVVHSDGDRVGEIIKLIEDGGKFKHSLFSKEMNNFALHAVKKLELYGGMPIYAGGDDLLFFAPVVNGKEDIFHLLKELDEDFSNHFKEFKIPVSQSFGLSIAYYKHPLAEMLDTSRNLLFIEAKSGKKNNIALRLEKHSGSFIATNLHLKDKSTGVFMEILKNHWTVMEQNCFDQLFTNFVKVKSYLI